MYYIQNFASFQQGGLIGIAVRFPHKYMGGMVEGQALGGIIAVTTNIIMLAVGLNDVDAAFYDFLIAIFYLVLSLGAFFYVTKTDFYKVIFEIVCIITLFQCTILRLPKSETSIM